MVSTRRMIPDSSFRPCEPTLEILKSTTTVGSLTSRSFTFLDSQEIVTVIGTASLIWNGVELKRGVKVITSSKGKGWILSHESKSIE